MRVFGQNGQMVAESPSRKLEDAVDLARREVAPTDLSVDASNLAPVSLELEAVRLYAESGSLAKVSRTIGIAIYELQKLQRTEWWQAELAALRRESSAMKLAMLTRLHDMSLEALEDRITHGDLIMRGNGFVRCKMSGRDLARASEAVFKQRQLLLGDPTHIHDVGNKTLEKLADKLRAVGYKDPFADAVDVEARHVPDQAPDTAKRAEPALSGFDAAGDD